MAILILENMSYMSSHHTVSGISDMRKTCSGLITTDSKATYPNSNRTANIDNQCIMEEHTQQIANTEIGSGSKAMSGL